LPFHTEIGAVVQEVIVLNLWPGLPFNGWPTTILALFQGNVHLNGDSFFLHYRTFLCHSHTKCENIVLSFFFAPLSWFWNKPMDYVIQIYPGLHNSEVNLFRKNISGSGYWVSEIKIRKQNLKFYSGQKNPELINNTFWKKKSGKEIIVFRK